MNAQEDFYKIEEAGGLVIYSSVFVSGDEIFYSTNLTSSIRRLTLRNLKDDFWNYPDFIAKVEKMKSRIADREALIFRSGVNISADVMACAPGLKLLVRAGSGLELPSGRATRSTTTGSGSSAPARTVARRSSSTPAGLATSSCSASTPSPTCRSPPSRSSGRPASRRATVPMPTRERSGGGSPRRRSPSSRAAGRA